MINRRPIGSRHTCQVEILKHRRRVGAAVLCDFTSMTIMRTYDFALILFWPRRRVPEGNCGLRPWASQRTCRMVGRRTLRSRRRWYRQSPQKRRGSSRKTEAPIAQKNLILQSSANAYPALASDADITIRGQVRSGQVRQIDFSG